MRHHLRLGALLPAIAGAAIAAGCGGSTTALVEGASSSPTGGTSSSETSKTQGAPGSSSSSGAFDLDVCTGDEHRLLEGVTRSDGIDPADGAVDYMELRDEYELDGSDPIVVAKQGTPCAFGPQTARCAQDLAALRSAAGWKVSSFGMDPARHRYLVWTTQDAIGTVTSLDSLRAFVQEVENVKDAALLATATGQYRFVCDGTHNAKQTATGWSLRVQSGHTCGEGTKIEEHVLEVTRSGEMAVTQTKLVKTGDPNCAIGRRPEGLVAKARVHGEEACADAVGRFFADAAQLEAASIVAFERLASELTALGAPQELVESARASRDDEIRHARMTAKVARRHGGRPTAPVVEPVAKRTMLEVALENAIEGCVRETYGALVAHHQALAATDPSIGAMMRAIAEDETRHAGLAWDVAAWLEPRLSDDDRRTVATARAEALEALRSALRFAPERELEVLAGMPTADRALALLDALEQRFIHEALT